MQPSPAATATNIALGEAAFWMQPFAEVEAGFAALRRTPGLTFHGEMEVPFLPRGPGFWAVVRHADVLSVSRDAQRFCSGRGTQIPDMPEAFNEFFGSMINLDDPRHARLRRIVSAGFTPRMLRRVEADVQRVAAQVVHAVAPRGACDFVTDVAAELPLRIICNLMGIPESHTRFVFDRTNVILGAHLARREITVMFRELFRRLPDLEITGPPQMLASNFIHGIKHMPCAFTPGGARQAH